MEEKQISAPPGKAPRKSNTSRFMSSLHGAADRSVAIRCATRLDKKLGALLRNAMVSEKLASRMLEGAHAPLGTFSARILAAASFGLITDWARKHLDLIRRVRNEFAHDDSRLLFDDPPVKEMCLSIHSLLDMAFEYDGKKPPSREPRQLFTMLVLELFLELDRQVKHVAPMEAIPLSRYSEIRIGAEAFESIQTRLTTMRSGDGAIRSWYMRWGPPGRLNPKRASRADAAEANSNSCKHDPRQ